MDDSFPSTTRLPVVRMAGGIATSDMDSLAVEEPLEIRVGERALAVTMRTPGDDEDLVLGFLLTESIVHDAADVESIRHWGSPNVIRAEVRTKLDWSRFQRHFYASSSCGVCGKGSIEAVRVHTTRLDDEERVRGSLLATLPDLLRARQAAFAATGAIHAAGAFAADGTLLNVREDIGRHNAVDKSVGAMLRAGRRADILVVSGRAGFEVVQKAIVARIPVVAAVGAPSSLAVELAQEMNLTLAGFVREGRFNVYAGEQRLLPNILVP
jgi:FdhD protein